MTSHLRLILQIQSMRLYSVILIFCVSIGSALRNTDLCHKLRCYRILKQFHVIPEIIYLQS